MLVLSAQYIGDMHIRPGFIYILKFRAAEIFILKLISQKYLLA